MADKSEKRAANKKNGNSDTIKDTSINTLSEENKTQSQSQSLKSSKQILFPSIPSPVMLPIWVIGIYVCYFVYGYLQEEIIAIEEINATLPLLFQYIIAMALSLGITTAMDKMKNQKRESIKSGELYVGLLNNFTMTASNYALEYIDYPTQALVKSSKILPVMIFGWFRGTYNHKMYKYFWAGLITLGLIIFNIAKLGSKVAGMSFSVVGLLLLFISLFFDGLLATQTDIEKNKREEPNVFHLMVANNIVGLLSCSVIMGFTYFVNGENLLTQVTMINIDELILIGVSSALGQIFIYITISRFDNFLLSVINTSRKFFSLLFSIIWFQHKIGYLHWIGIILVIGALIIDMVLSEKERQDKKK